MSREDTSEPQPPVSCHICHREVPQAEALTAEGQEYLYYFCGRGCYTRWEHENEAVSPNRKHQADRR